MIVSGTKGQKAESAEEDQAAAKKEEATGGGEGREGESLRRGELEGCCIAYSRPMRDGPDSESGRGGRAGRRRCYSTKLAYFDG